MRSISNILERRHGQSMVEFALILPLLLVLMFGIIELGIMFSIYVGMTNSAREAARAGAVYQYTGTPFSDNGDPAVTAAYKANVDEQRLQYLSQVITDTLNPIVDSKALTVTVSYTSTSILKPEYQTVYRDRELINVSIDHDHQLFFGLFGTQKITIKATSTMRIEPGAIQ